MNKPDFKDLPDEFILKKIVEEKKNELYDIIYRRYFPRVTDKCYSFLKDKSKAREFANDILIKVYEKLPGFRQDSSFSSWLYSVTYNYLIDFLRKKKQLHYPRWNSENEIPEIIDETDSDISEITYENLISILEKIHVEEKAILLMKYQDNLSLKEIAQILIISEDAVKMRLKRARSRVIYLYQKNYS